MRLLKKLPYTPLSNDLERVLQQIIKKEFGLKVSRNTSINFHKIYLKGHQNFSKFISHKTFEV